ncbi:hypothetical protein [Streptomyces sp. NPDC023838]|uniref:hypothetical protein n=1 Tax=Streptomyces sp. NPDC023838 TaxID=3154325 RepID=UPI0033DFBF3C
MGGQDPQAVIAMADFRAGWKAEGLTVTYIAPWDDRSSGPGLSGVRATHHGFELSLQQPWYADHLTVYESGECLR